MAKHKRSAVFVALSNTVGHELIFRHYTNKVVVADFPDSKQEKKSIKTQARKPRTKK